MGTVYTKPGVILYTLTFQQLHISSKDTPQRWATISYYHINVYMYLYVFVYVLVYVYVFVCVCVYVFECAYVYILYIVLGQYFVYSS